jgi:hypothetical protein
MELQRLVQGLEARRTRHDSAPNLVVAHLHFGRATLDAGVEVEEVTAALVLPGSDAQVAVTTPGRCRG